MGVVECEKLPRTTHARVAPCLIVCVHLSAESADKGGRVNWRKVPVKLFEADLGRNDVQVSVCLYHMNCVELWTRLRLYSWFLATGHNASLMGLAKDGTGIL